MVEQGRQVGQTVKIVNGQLGELAMVGAVGLGRGVAVVGEGRERGRPPRALEFAVALANPGGCRER